MLNQKPDTNTYGQYYQKYVDSLPSGNILEILSNQLETFTPFIKKLTKDQLAYAYEPGKWTVRQSLVHIFDTERVFAYRILAISRGEQQPLPGFDQNEWIDSLDLAHRTAHDLAEEFITIRNATHSLARSLTEEQWKRSGTASGSAAQPYAIIWIIAGHLQHHINLYKQRYKL